MPKVAGVRLRYSKTLWFDPAGTTPEVGDIVIVSTERGDELGVVRHEIAEVDESALAAELKPLIRIATQEDLEHAVELQELEKSAMPIFRDLITQNELDMKPVDIEYLFGGDKIIFYFSSDERVDFRQLVKDLAQHFHMRIDMRQVGVRDEARMVGGVGHCGEILCCARLGGEFAPVSIKMAKDQGLPPNPIKISGACGRLMCCLRYEVDAYKDFAARAPKKGAVIDTPKGDAQVVDYNVLRELISVRFASTDGPSERLDIPLDKMTCSQKKSCKGHGAYGSCGRDAEGNMVDRTKPCCVSKEAMAEIEAGGSHDDSVMMPTVTYTKLKDGGTPSKVGTSITEIPNNQDRSSDDASSASARKSRKRRKPQKGDKGPKKIVLGDQDRLDDDVLDGGTTPELHAPKPNGTKSAQPKKPSRRRGRKRGPKPESTGSKDATPTQSVRASAPSTPAQPSAQPSIQREGRVPRRRRNPS